MLWKYQYDNAIGVVIANTKEEAHAKVFGAYKKHSDAIEYSDIQIKNFSLGGYFKDCPDVYEVFDW